LLIEINIGNNHNDHLQVNTLKPSLDIKCLWMLTSPQAIPFAIKIDPFEPTNEYSW
jgi:hypothetical protein